MQQAPGGYGPQGYQQGYAPMIWTCPFCRWQGPPSRISKVSGSGWAVFWVVGLLTCMLFCWIGLLMRDTYTACPNCGTRIGA